MKTRIKKLLTLALAFSSLTLVGCQCGPGEIDDPIDNPGGDNPGEDDKGQGFENNHYNENNFIKNNDKVVTKTKVTYYDGPSLLESSSIASVKVEGQDLFVYETRVNLNKTFTFNYPTTLNPVALFDFEGKVHVEVTFNNVEVITSAKISPLVYGITPEAKGNTLSFDLSYNDNYVIEVNGDSNNVLHLFANPIEEDPITKEEAEADPNIVYFGPGLYDASAIPVSSNQTIYLAGGAYVYGKIRMEDVENVTVRGRGIISGSIYDRRSNNEYNIPVEVRYSKNINFEGITFLDPAGWCFALYHSEDINLDNVKIITARANGDGISVQSCKNVNVKGGFVRTFDDSLVVKNEDEGTTSNIVFDGVNVWTDLAQSMEVGYETNGATMDGITFKNITVIHNFHKPVISLHNADDAKITNVKYQNITLEDGQMLGDVQDDGEDDFFIDFAIEYSPEWSVSGNNRGSVDGVIVDDVKVYDVAESVVSEINGFDATHQIQNVSLTNIDYEGVVVSSAEDLKLTTNDFVSNLKIESTKTADEILGAIKTLPYTLNLESEEIEKTVVEHIEQAGILVPEFSYMNGDPSYIGVKTDTSKTTVKATHGKGTTNTAKWDDGSGDFYNAENPLTNAIDGSYETAVENGTWKNEKDEFMALTFDFGDELKNIGTIRLFGPQGNEFKYTYRISVFGRKLKSDGTLNENFTRTLAIADYDLTPANGNYIDINITPGEFGAIQLRFYRIDDEMSVIDNYEINEVEFYGQSLTYHKQVVDSTEHNDVYDVSKVLDGEVGGTSYYESKTVPATIVIDLGDVVTMNVLVLSLPPELTWQARTQNIEISVSDSNVAYSANTEFEVIKESSDYLFDPKIGNSITFEFDGGISLRFLKVKINSNSINGDSKYGAQLSEISAY